MPNITKPSDYNAKPLRIELAVSENAGEDSNIDVSNVITKSEKYILIQLLGYVQYSALQTELEKAPFVTGAAETASESFVGLVNGDEVNGWEGLSPLLMNFTYCAWLRADEIKVNVVGSGKGKAQAFTVADNSANYVYAWNEFVRHLGCLETYLDETSTLVKGDKFPIYETENQLGL